MSCASVQAHKVADGVISVELTGSITGQVLDTLREVLVKVLLQQRPARVVVSLAAVTVLDPFAVGCLIGASQAAADLDIEWTATGWHGAVRELCDHAADETDARL